MKEYKRPNEDKWFEAFFENSPYAMLFVRDTDGKVVDANKYARNLLGYDHEELCNMNINNIIIGMKDNYMETASTINGFSKTRKGVIILSEISSGRINLDGESYTAVAMRNIGESSYLKEIADNFPDVLIKINTSGFAEYISPSCRKILGYEPASLTGRRMYDNIHQDDMYKALKTLYEVINLKRKLKTEFRYKKADNQYIWLEVIISPVYDENKYYDGVIAVCRDITERKKTEEMIRYMAYHDPLTGLPNRKTIDDTLRNLMDENKKSMFAIMFIDIDNFKGINDTMGHDAGDIILKETAKRLKTLEKHNCLAARLGGDEFIIIEKHISSEETCIQLAENTSKLFKTGIMLNGRDVQVNLSMGISIYPKHGNDLRTLKRNADMAMYTAKRIKGNSYEMFEGKVLEKALEGII